MNADDALQQLVRASVISVAGTRSVAADDECVDFRIVTDKGELVAYATNNGGIAIEWKAAP